MVSSDPQRRFPPPWIVKKLNEDCFTVQIATLTASDDAAPRVPNADQPALADIPRLLQAELRRVGCNTGAIDGNWNAAAQRSLSLFNKNAGMKLDVKIASLDALDIVRSKTVRICPLICEHGYKADGDNCVKITCGAGFEVGDDNTCERIVAKKPVTAGEHRSRSSPGGKCFSFGGKSYC
jgi:hypothetical protein